MRRTRNVRKCTDPRKASLASTKVVITVIDAVLWGCPGCGYRVLDIKLSEEGRGRATCDNCEMQYDLVAADDGSDGLKRKRMVLPKAQAHPRQGFAFHSRKSGELPPAEESFRIRTVGPEVDLTCFVCDRSEPLLQSITGRVLDAEAGKRVIAMFRDNHAHARLEGLDVLVGACDTHVIKLRELKNVCQDNGITKARIKYILVM